MNVPYRTFFGLEREPFGAELALSEILKTPDILAVKERFDYTIRLGAVALVTGEIGSGKSTAIRYASGSLHPSEYRILSISATSGSILELYRQLLGELGIDTSSPSRSLLTGRIKREIAELVQTKKMKVVLLIDEASLLRLEVFSELHTITQFDYDSKAWLPIILVGQNNLVDKLTYRASLPLASRIVARSHLEGVTKEDMEKYLRHHLTIAGVKQNLFEEAASIAIHQGSGGLFRKANHLARGSLVAAAREKSSTITPEHVRLASTEIF